MSSATVAAETVTAIGRAGVVAVVRTTSVTQAAEVSRAALAGGVRVLEITLSVPGAVDLIGDLVAEVGGDALVGVGTVLDGRSLQQAVASGARFAVSPVVDPDVVAAGAEAGVPVIPGALTPTEVGAALRAGAPVVKLFPAGSVGPAHLAALGQVFPAARFVPTGGIGVDEVRPWRAAGAFAVGIGGSLDRAMREGGAAAVTQLCAHLAQRWVEGNTAPLGDGT